MNLRVLLLAVVSAGLVAFVLRRRSQRARAEAELWAEATDDVA